MSLPSVKFPERLYRNNLDAVKRFLDARVGHDEQPGTDVEKQGKYLIFELRAEGAGYKDDAFDGKVVHFPFIDHQPPPFSLLLDIIREMKVFLSSNVTEISTSRLDANAEAGQKHKQNVAVIHCKAGKGRSGLVTCSFLVAYRDWAEQDARARFTKMRMRPGYGEGVSIPSQQRWLRYITFWAKDKFAYPPPLPRDGSATAAAASSSTLRINISAITVKNLKSGCRLAVQGFARDGQEIVTRRELHDKDKTMAASDAMSQWTFNDLEMENDVCIYLSHGNAFAHFWFNAELETRMHGQQVFTIEWEEVDGWKGTKWRGSRAYDAVTVAWTRTAD